MSSLALEGTAVAPGLAGLTVLADGTHEWRGADGALHRVGGPAVEVPGATREFWQHGMRHADAGPAVERLVFPGFFRGMRWHAAQGPPCLRLEFWRYGVLHRD